MAGLQAMAGQAEAAQATVGRALALAGDMGENRVAALAREFAASALSLAGDPAAAARQLRQGIRVLERQGESGMRSNLTADLAHVLHQLGRPDEASTPPWPAGPSPPTTTCSPRSAGAAPPPGPWPSRAASTTPNGSPPRRSASPRRPTC